MPRSGSPELRDCIESLKAESDRCLSARELSDIIGEVARTLTLDLGPLSNAEPSDGEGAGDASAADGGGAALDALADVGAIDQGDGLLADLWKDLDEIRTVTQDAAAKYLSCAETVESVADRPDLESDDQAMLSHLATDMYEAASFQDLTGLRLTRIGEILRRIEFLVASAKAALGDEDAAAEADALSETVEKTENRKMEYILHGPEEARTANTQEEIDKILASFD